jgi:hypothetical protein
MTFTPKRNSGLRKVGKSISITNKLLKEIESREVVPSDDYRVSIPDKTFQRYLSQVKQVRVDNGTVAYKEIKNIESIEMQDYLAIMLLESLEGLEYFKSLTVLRIATSSITKLDVSKNIHLTHLNCGGCRKLAHLDVTKNKVLEFLSCQYNSILELDVSNNLNLTELWCSGNQLKSLDLSNNAFLVKLYSHSNQLTSIDLSKNPLLEIVMLRNNPGDWWKGLEKG